MYYKKNIMNAIDYINRNIENDMTIEDISRAAGFSSSHFYKLFTALTGFTVKEYIRNKRLSAAAKKLVKTDNRIIDIAMDANFQSHEVFTRAFTSLYGTSPLKYRKSRNEILLFEKINEFGESIKDKFEYIQEDININVKVLEEKEIYLVGMDIKTSVSENIEKKILRSFWQNEFLPRSHKIKNKIDPNSWVYFEITNPETDELYHLSCFQVSTPEAPAGMILKLLPSLKYAVFAPEKPLNALEYSSLITYAYGEWLPISGYQLADNFTFDVMHREKVGEQTICANMEIYVPIR